MRLSADPAFPFDRFLPMYNWIYPVSAAPDPRWSDSNAEGVFDRITPAESRALYVHIPFCETICSFCPFVRAKYRDDSVLDSYVHALVTEIRLKGQHRALSDVPVGAIYFGGGTPSLLQPKHARKIIGALSDCFDLDGVREFSFEFEAKSVRPELTETLRQLGVTHARFGLQTLSPEYRRLFNLTATVDDVLKATELLRKTFPVVTCDVLYGMSGQTPADLQQEIEEVTSLGLDNLDWYPINNLVTQPRLHRALEGRRPVSGLEKHYYRLAIRAGLHEHGYLPHNGHGWVRVPREELDRDPVVTSRYSFVYHEHVLGFPRHDLLGFGANAVSSFSGVVVSNLASRSRYSESLGHGQLPVRVATHPPELDAARPLCLALPYHGSISRECVTEQVPEKLRLRLRAVVEVGLVEEGEENLCLTRKGWDWYTSLMYYLLPTRERAAIDTVIAAATDVRWRKIETSIASLDFSVAQEKDSSPSANHGNAQ